MPWAGEGYQRVEPSRRNGEVWIGVLPQNVGIVEVFQRCQPQLALGLSVYWEGVGALEVQAACEMSLVPQTEWPRYIDGVRLMAQVVANIRNEQEAKRSKKGKRAK